VQVLGHSHETALEITKLDFFNTKVELVRTRRFVLFLDIEDSNRRLSSGPLFLALLVFVPRHVDFEAANRPRLQLAVALLDYCFRVLRIEQLAVALKHQPLLTSLAPRSSTHLIIDLDEPFLGGEPRELSVAEVVFGEEVLGELPDLLIVKGRRAHYFHKIHVFL